MGKLEEEFPKIGVIQMKCSAHRAIPAKCQKYAKKKGSPTLEISRGNGKMTRGECGYVGLAACQLSNARAVKLKIGVGGRFKNLETEI